jgi:hypothetical protein
MSQQVRERTSSADVSQSSHEYEAAGKVAKWAFYGLFGFWIQLAVAVTLVGVGISLILALPVTVLQLLGIVPFNSLLKYGWESWLTQTAIGQLILGVVMSAIGSLFLAIAYRIRHWILWHPR